MLVKLTFEINFALATAFISYVCMQQPMDDLKKVSKNFETENISTHGGFEPPILGFVRMLYYLIYRVQTFSTPSFETLVLQV